MLHRQRSTCRLRAAYHCRGRHILTPAVAAISSLYVSHYPSRRAGEETAHGASFVVRQFLLYTLVAGINTERHAG